MDEHTQLSQHMLHISTAQHGNNKYNLQSFLHYPVQESAQNIHLFERRTATTPIKVCTSLAVLTAKLYAKQTSTNSIADTHTTTDMITLPSAVQHCWLGRWATDLQKVSGLLVPAVEIICSHTCMLCYLCHATF